MSIVQKKAYLLLAVQFWKPLVEKGILIFFILYIYTFKVLFTTSLYV